MNHIVFDHDWNCRLRIEGNSNDPEDMSGGFEGLKASIRAGMKDGSPWSGVDQPICVQPIEDGKYKCISGFRRSEAVRQLSQELNIRDVYMPCIIIQTDDIGARAMNLRENVHRKNISAADTTFAIGVMAKEAPRMTVKELSILTGIQPRRVSDMIRIYREVDPKILTHWRKAVAAPLSIEKMRKLADLPRDKQAAAYKTAHANHAACRSERGAWRARRWEDRFRAIGTLARMGLLDVDARKLVSASVALWSDETEDDGAMIRAIEEGLR